MANKLLIILTAMSCLAFDLAPASERGETFARSTAALQAGASQDAAEGLQQLIAGGHYAPEAFFNLALAFEKNGDAFNALLNYRRALILDPRMTAARRNLFELAAQEGLVAPEFTWRDDLSTLITPSWLLIGGSVLGWIGAFTTVLAVLTSGRRSILAGGLIACFAGGAIATAGFLAEPKWVEMRTALVSAKEGALARSAAADNSQVIARLPIGSAVQVLHRRGAWSHCQMKDGAEVWIESDALVPLIPQQGRGDPSP